MSSTTLYPPIVDSCLPAFIAGGNSSYCRFYFSLSKISSSTSPIKSIHLSIVKQNNGQSVVKRQDTETRFRSSGIIIINTAPIPVANKDNLYYVDILNEDIQAGDISGWQIGWIYKIQIRLATVAYDGSIGQTAWLNLNANNFSEWSTFCTTKAIGKPRITAPVIKNFDSDVDAKKNKKVYVLDLSTLDFNGTYSNADVSETLYSYRLQLFDSNNELLEDSNIIYTNQYYNPNQFHYLFKTELKNNYRYFLKLYYSTINKYEELYNFNILIEQAPLEETVINVVTVDTVHLTEDEDFIKNMRSFTSKVWEEDEGKMIVKLYSENTEPIMANICIRRADSRDNFQTWTDIKIVHCINKVVNDLAPVEDFTIESGIWYKYGVQTIDVYGNRDLLRVYKEDTGSLREFEYAFLLGEDNRQLKVKYNNTMNSYTYNYAESNTDTIGGEYTTFSRNGNMKYRTFPLNGLISFTMDEDNEQFTSDKELYKYDNIIKKYQDRRTEEHLSIYDYRKEFDFREKVLEFLYDGKPKLFKSSTEGNIIIRLTRVSASPEQAVNRLIFSFSSVAYEIAQATMENYLKYNFYNPGGYLTSFEEVVTKIGQLDLYFPVGDDLINKIWDTYDYSEQDMADYKLFIREVKNLSIEFLDSPFIVVNNIGDEVFGNNFLYNNMKFTVNAEGTRIYAFDPNITFNQTDTINILGDEAGQVEYVHILVNFLYDLVKKPVVGPHVTSRTIVKNVGQVFGTYKSGDNIYNDIYYKYYYDWSKGFGVLYRLAWTCIEAEPHAVFQVRDRDNIFYYEINDTGILNFEDYDNNIKSIIYEGIRQNDGTIDTTQRITISINYIYQMIKGTYKEE